MMMSRISTDWTGDAPGARLRVEHLLDLLAKAVTVRQHVGDSCLRSRRAGPSGRERHRVDEVRDLQDRLLGVPHHPERDRVDVDGHRVAGEVSSALKSVTRMRWST